MTFRAYILGQSETVTDSPLVARVAYAELLAREDLQGEPVEAILERDGQKLYVSRFDCLAGAGAIHREAPLDVYAPLGDNQRVVNWRPAVC